jgi:hypothetical protein
VARIPEIPNCGIRWDRLFSLPVAVAPETLTAAKRLEYVKSVGIAADVVNSTFTRYLTTSPTSAVGRVTTGGAGAKTVLPRETGAAAISGEQAFTAAAIAGVTTVSNFSTREFPAGAKPADVELALAKSLVRDDVSRKFSRLAIPFAGLDAIRFYWRSQAASGFAGTLGLSIPSALPSATFPAPPEYLLETHEAAANGSAPLQLGEVDRLLLRAPVTGAFRFEPYFHYAFKAPSTLEVIGRSTTGRLLVRQPALASFERMLDKTETLVFRSRVFAFEHVSRAAVARLLHQSLMLHLGTFDQLVANWRGRAGADRRFAVPPTSREVYTWLVGDVKGLLRSWVAFLSTLATRPEDIAVAAAVGGKDWVRKLTPAPATSADDQKCLAIVQDIAGHKEWLESIAHFSDTFYAPALAGYSWAEILTGAAINPAKRFPGVADAPPYSSKDRASIAAYERLRLLQDPGARWVACFAGCPIGAPAPLYASPAPPPGATDYPSSALTTFDVEALHLAGQASQALFGDASVAAQPAATVSTAMDLAPFSAKQIGHASLFQSEPLADNPFHTAVDWLLEVVRGIHRRSAENGWLDLGAYLDDATRNAGHPLLSVLRFDDHLRAVAIRTQMNSLRTDAVDTDAQKWWTTAAAALRPGIGALTPASAYPDDATRPQRPPGSVVGYAAIRGAAPPKAGLNTFDLESAYLANSRLASPLPMPVVLALLETEGITTFSSVNRCTGFRASAAVRWEASPAPPSPEWTLINLKKVYDEAGSDLVGRFNWLRWPYGLDEFMIRADYKPEVLQKLPHKVPPETDAEYSTRIIATYVDDLHATVWAGGKSHPDVPFDLKVSTRLSNTNVLKLGTAESIGAYIRHRVDSDYGPAAPVMLAGASGPQPVGAVRIWKKTQRVHWAIISLMVGWYSMRENDICNAADGCVTPDKAAWLPAASSPPPIGGFHPDSDQWRDFISYYALIYLAYNAGPQTWAAHVAGAEAARTASGSSLSRRDYLLFRYWPAAAPATLRLGIFNMVRFAVALDDYLRLDFLDGRAPKDYAAAAPDNTKASAIVPARWGL